MAAGEYRDVSSIMQGTPRVVGPEDRLDLANVVMKLGGIRHLPVVQEGRLVGIVSQRDLLAAALSSVLDPSRRDEERLRGVEVSEVMTRNPCTARLDTPLREAAALLLSERIGCLPVVDPDGRLIGVVTETDMLRGAYGGD